MALECRRALRKHDSLREGVRLGLVMATTVWIWLAVVDAITGEPFHTFTVLGGIGVFTGLHYLFNLMYGVIIVAGIHGSAEEPSLVGVILSGVVIVEFGFVMGTILLSNAGLGNLAWVRIFGGSLIGAAVATVIVVRGHPFLTRMEVAHE